MALSMALVLVLAAGCSRHEGEGVRTGSAGRQESGAAAVRGDDPGHDGEEHGRAGGRSPGRIGHDHDDHRDDRDRHAHTIGDNAGDGDPHHDGPAHEGASRRTRIPAAMAARVGLRSEMGGSLQAMAFRAETSPLGAFLITNRGQVVHVAGTLSSNFWNGRRSAQFRIVDAAGI